MSSQLRRLVAESRAASARARSSNDTNFILRMLVGWRSRQNPDERTDAMYDEANADLDRWDAEVARRAR